MITRSGAGADLGRRSAMVRFPNRSCYGARIGSTIKPRTGTVVVALAAPVGTGLQRRTLLTVNGNLPAEEVTERISLAVDPIFDQVFDSLV
jgi:hypothetical protein